ncbi:MAG: FlgD immunoglobulin-like domain containing protein [bacterium]|nr:FlgD immunoglobulin-like domain containing protein [bacterium]
MNKVRTVIVLFAMVLFAFNAFAIYDWQPLQQNNLISAITNYGQLGQIMGGSGSYTFWPAPALDIYGNIAPPAMNYVYGWGLWVGAQTKDGDTLVTVGYNPNNSTGEFTAGAVIGGVAQNVTDPGVKIYVSTESDWPLKKTNGQDSIISMCDTRCVYNDYLTSNHAVGGVPLKIEVTQTTYQWSTPGLQDIIYLMFEVNNTGTDTLYNVYLAPTADCDIGNESSAPNDICYYDTTTNMAYQYQTSSTEVGWTRQPGCVGLNFLQGPIATKNYTYPDARQIFAGDTLGLTHFKIFSLAIDPPTDIDQYKELAGYDYTTGTYAAFDPKPGQADQRFMESTGPIDIAPGQTARVIVCLICANYDYGYMFTNDTLAIKELREKARTAKIVFENSIVYNQTQITLTAPAGGAVLSGTQNITWTYGGNALATDTVDLYYSPNGYSWDSLSFNRPNTGSYSWNTIGLSDGIKYKIAAILHGPQKLASSVSDSFLVVNNAGNAAPELLMAVPDTVICGNYSWKWMAGDADQDELIVSHYVMREGTGAWQKVAGTISSTPNNTQQWLEYDYTWNTDTMLNADYKLKTVCYDGQVTTTDSSINYYQLFNQRVQYPGSVSGHSTLPVNWYTYNPSLINGHSYEARFKGIVRGAYNSTYGKYAASYKYDLWDVTGTTLCSAGWIIPETYTSLFYYKDGTGQPWSGFAILCGDTTFKPSQGTFDSVIRPVTDLSTDTLYWASINIPDLGWAKLNGNYEIRWHVTGTNPTDTLWPEVWDLTYGVQVPYDSTILNNITTPSWNLGGTSAGLGRRYIVNVSNLYRKFMNVCGMRFFFKNPTHTAVGLDMTWATHPQEGDVWNIYSSGPIPPRDGDVYSFTPTSVEGAPSEISAASFLLQQNAPNPFKQATTINYQLAQPGMVNLKVYNIAGQLVKTLVSGKAGAGPHSVKWNGRDNAGNKVSSGIYIYRLQAENKEMTRKLVILR